MICPCKTCARMGCGAAHDTCRGFLEWKRHVARVTARRAAENDVAVYIVSTRIRRIIRGKQKWK